MIAAESQPPLGEFNLEATGPYPWNDALFYLASRRVPGVEAVDLFAPGGPGERAGVYRRSISLEGASGSIEVRALISRGAEPGRLRVRISPGLKGLETAVASRLRRLFDLDLDPRLVLKHLGEDPYVGASVCSRPGLPCPGAFDGFEVAARTILGQQVSTAGATTLATRLVKRFGAPLPLEEMLAPEGEGPTHLFPSTQAVADAPVGEIGLTKQRSRALINLATALRDGELDLNGGQGVREATSALLSLSGIGPWTASIVGFSVLGDHDAFPSGDLILRRLCAPPGETLSIKELEAHSQGWRPLRAYATMHLWMSYLRPSPE